VTRAGKGPLRVLLVEDASTQRSQLTAVLQDQGDLIVVGCASTSAEAIVAVARDRPDVVILDLHLADGGSQRAIEQIMAHAPKPILTLSARIQDRRSPSAVEALVAGALEALPRPQHWTPEQGAELRRVVRQISKVHVIRHPRGSRRTAAEGGADAGHAPHPVVAVAASTGGPGALATLLAGLTRLDAPVLVVQHLHPDFTAGLVDWMSRVSALPVETAAHGQPARPGRVYVAPGGRHLRHTANGRLELATSPVTTHRPSADQLFQSVAESAGRAGIGVLLTGMGDDGARGLLAIRQQGGRTLAQDEASSTVFGMPKAAARIGAVTELLPIDKLADALQRAVQEVRTGDGR
jgi:two-component system chemotaxis response regulator CheB